MTTYNPCTFYSSDKQSALQVKNGDLKDMDNNEIGLYFHCLLSTLKFSYDHNREREKKKGNC